MSGITKVSRSSFQGPIAMKQWIQSMDSISESNGRNQWTQWLSNAQAIPTRSSFQLTYAEVSFGSIQFCQMFHLLQLQDNWCSAASQLLVYFVIRCNRELFGTIHANFDCLQLALADLYVASLDGLMEHPKKKHSKRLKRGLNYIFVHLQAHEAS